MNNNNTFESGTIVSMPDLSLIDLPNSGWEKNEGLQSAVREGGYRLRIVNKLGYILSGLAARDAEYLPDYVDPLDPINYVYPNGGKGITMDDLIEERVNIVACHNNGVLKIDEDDAIQHVVILTDCQVKFGQGLRVENSIIATTNTDIKSLTSSSNLVIGKDDNCATGGGTQFLTLGGMSFTSGLSIFGSQLIAKKDIEFSANANGIQGALS
ncbi:hypothetical protein K3556_16075 (plasmid) [Aliiroseovarius sp. M344]|uniref:hypothetical protein n=1 Tax=Aliiroseovarius sp. M344 TaxID=2867010 RepID=UPI0021AD7C0D|nr:hypothetical protein [Aliiroseovarius sp. M344]UWQ15960.1 hypothetical protein K3556_16075 [Aliiroseovarius sp. M344]